MTDAATSSAQYALDGDLDALASSAAAYLDQGEVVYDADGDPAGVTYHDHGQWYAADMVDLREFVETVASGIRDAYSHWCAATAAEGHPSAAVAATDLV